MSPSAVILLAGGFGIAYFAIATTVGIATGLDPAEASTPLGYRVFLWPAARVWCAIFPEIRGGK